MIWKKVMEGQFSGAAGPSGLFYWSEVQSNGLQVKDLLGSVVIAGGGAVGTTVTVQVEIFGGPTADTTTMFSLGSMTGTPITTSGKTFPFGAPLTPITGMSQPHYRAKLTVISATGDLVRLELYLGGKQY